MSFLNVMQKVEKAEVNSNVPKVNPLLAKINTGGTPAKAPNPLLKTQAKATADTKEPKENSEELVEKTIQQKAVEEALKEIESNQNAAPKTADTEAVLETEEILEAEVTVEDSSDETEETKEETTKKTNKRGGKRGSKTKEPKAVNQPKKEEEDESVEVFSTRISYEEAIAAIKTPFSNDEFEELKEEIATELNQIVISEDMNSLVAKSVNAQLAALYEKIWFEFQAAKTLFDNLNQKDTGLIDVVKYSSIGDGTNDAQRKKAGIEACMRYVAPGATEPVNLFELLSYSREQYYFFKGVMDHLDFKKNVMISMNASLKIENNVLGSGSDIK